MSSNAVMRTTSTEGRRRRIISRNARPPISGMRTSHNTSSGSNRSIFGSAVTPSSAVSTSAPFHQRFAERRADVGVVVDDQNAARRGHDRQENNTPYATS